MRRILRWVGVLLAFVLLLVAAGLAWAHVSIRDVEPPLPPGGAFSALGVPEDAPVELFVINTASQEMPREAVLSPARDPDPDARYVMSHPSFVLRWADGRILLVDAGMTPEAAVEFGQPLEWLGGAAPMQPHGSTAQQLGGQVSHVEAVLFTHLHVDHVGGIEPLCEDAGHGIDVWMTPQQADLRNYTTRGAADIVENAACTRVRRLEPGALAAVPGFPGVHVIAAAGHTPGSQIVAATVRGEEGTRRVLFTGDITNHVDGIRHDIPKPFLYRLLVVPENDARLGTLRRLLRDLASRHDWTVLPAHDELHIRESGIRRFAPQGKSKR